MDGLSDIFAIRAPTAHRPLLGLTILIVEDSRFACEAVRLLCLRSGARIRRADNLENARRHLNVYRPSVLLADVGLPDGSGLELIKSLTDATPRIEVILGISGDSTVESDVIEAGADGFLEKPIDSIAAFQSAILAHIPANRQPPGPRLLTDETVNPDLIAYQDDLTHIAQILDDPDDENNIDYIAQFLSGVARSARDHALDKAARDIARERHEGANVKPKVATLSQMVQSRIAAGGQI